MDLADILSGGSSYVRDNKPRTPDMDRITEIVLQMKATAGSPAAIGMAEYEKRWKARIEESIDYDSLAWQALNVGFEMYDVKTVGDLQRLRRDQRKNSEFIRCVQAFYDGFLLGVQFEKRGGHRD